MLNVFFSESLAFVAGNIQKDMYTYIYIHMYIYICLYGVLSFKASQIQVNLRMFSKKLCDEMPSTAELLNVRCRDCFFTEKDSPTKNVGIKSIICSIKLTP